MRLQTRFIPLRSISHCGRVRLRGKDKRSNKKSIIPACRLAGIRLLSIISFQWYLLNKPPPNCIRSLEHTRACFLNSIVEFGVVAFAAVDDFGHFAVFDFRD